MPSCQICLSLKQSRAFLKNINIIRAAIANLANTKVATTPFVPNSDFSSGRASKACFIQMKVAPQTKVTANNAAMAICLSRFVLSRVISALIGTPSDIMLLDNSSAL